MMKRHPSIGRAVPIGLLLLLAGGCGEEQPPPSTRVVSPPAATPAAPPSDGTPESNAQRAWGGNLGRVNVMVAFGELYARRVSQTLPVLAAVVRVTNGTSFPVALDRARDEFVLRLADGREVPRVDLWANADWMTRIAALPAPDRARFVYPTEVIPDAGVEFTITFPGGVALDQPREVWVRLATLPGEGVWLTPLTEPSPPRNAPRAPV